MIHSFGRVPTNSFRSALVASSVAVSLLVWASTANAEAPAEGVPAASGPASNVSFSVVAAKAGAPWVMRLKNTGTAPAIVLADARFLRFELLPNAPIAPNTSKANKANKAKPLTCALPADALPLSVTERELVLPPGKTYSEKFDPSFYCFDAKSAALWVAGTTVSPALGFPSKSPRTKGGKQAPPFIARDSAETEGQHAEKLLQAEPITLTEGDVAAPTDVPSAPGTKKTATLLPLTTSLPGRLDVARGTEAGTSVSVANTHSSSVSLLARPSTLALTVAKDGREVRCSAQASAGRIPELYSTLAPKAKTSVAVDIVSLCPPHTFDEPGVYRVRALVDSSGTESEGVMPKALRGVSPPGDPMLLRVRAQRPSQAGIPGNAPKRPAYE